MATIDTTTALDEWFLSSGYRHGLLDERLYHVCNDHREGSIGGPLPRRTGYVTAMRELTQTRTWLDDSFSKMRIEYPNAHGCAHDCVVAYLSAFYNNVKVECQSQDSVTVTVKVAPMDSAWLRMVANGHRAI